MIFSDSSSELSPKVSILIDQVPVDYFRIQRLEIEFEENMHDLMTLDFAGLSPELMHLYIEAPITVTVAVAGSEPVTFNGYIVFLDPLSDTKAGLVNGSPFQITRAYCLGASYRMRYKKFKAWDRSTLPTIAQAIATEHGLSVAVPNDTYVFPRMIQSSESNWAFLVRAANELGYNVAVHNTHIHIWDPYRSMSRKISFTPLTTLRGTKGNTTPIPGQVLSFSGRIGDVTPEGSRSSDTLFALDENNQIVSATNKDTLETSSLGTPVPRVFSNVMSDNATSYAMAQKKVAAALRRKFPITAVVTTTGETSSHPGGIVYLDSYDTQFDGFWYVKSVRHTVVLSSMTTTFSVAKDALGPLNTPPVPMLEHETPPPSAIVNGVWVASVNKATVYS